MGKLKVFFRGAGSTGVICGVLLILGLCGSGCTKVHKIEGESWTIPGADGQIIVEDGEYYFGLKKKDPKETIVSEYSKHACYFKFRLGNLTNRGLQIKTMGELLDKSGKPLEKVMTSYYTNLEPGKYEIIEGFFGVTQKDVLETAQFEVTIEDFNID